MLELSFRSYDNSDDDDDNDDMHDRMGLKVPLPITIKKEELFESVSNTIINFERFESTEQLVEETQPITQPDHKKITSTLNPSEEIIQVTLPELFPLSKSDIVDISKESFLAALREENKIKDPEVLHKNCYIAMNTLKTHNTLDNYILNENEAAVICSIPILLNEGFSIQNMIKSCKEKAPSKLMIMMLISLRKLPRYRGHMYFIIKRKKKTKQKKKGNTIQLSFCIATKEMSEIGDNGDTNAYKKVFNVEDGWGYDISDFVLTKNEEEGWYGKKD